MAIKIQKWNVHSPKIASAETSAAINQQFYNIIRLSEQADQITEIGYQVRNCYKILKKTCLTCQRHVKNKMFKS